MIENLNANEQCPETLDIKDSQGLLPYDYAIKRGHSEAGKKEKMRN